LILGLASFIEHRLVTDRQTDVVWLVSADASAHL